MIREVAMQRPDNDTIGCLLLALGAFLCFVACIVVIVLTYKGEM